MEIVATSLSQSQRFFLPLSVAFPLSTSPMALSTCCRSLKIYQHGLNLAAVPLLPKPQLLHLFLCLSLLQPPFYLARFVSLKLCVLTSLPLSSLNRHAHSHGFNLPMDIVSHPQMPDGHDDSAHIMTPLKIQGLFGSGLSIFFLNYVVSFFFV